MAYFVSQTILMFQEFNLHHVSIMITPIKIMCPRLPAKKWQSLILISDSVKLWYSARNTQGAGPVLRASD